MREQTAYEKQKWTDWYGNPPTFLFYGDELGEAYETACNVTRMGSYGFSDEFVEAGKIQVLDMYYYQIHIYTGEYGGAYEEPEEQGLPPRELVHEKAKELGVDRISYETEDFSDSARELWDWCIAWREEHWEETEKRLRRERLEKELRRLNA